MKNISRIVVFIFALAHLPCEGVLAQEGCPDMNLSTVVQNIQGDTALLITPDGSGARLSEATQNDGSLVDATIFLTLFSNCPPTGPLVGYPAEDMWLESTAGSLVFCSGGSIADAATDDQGSTTWSGPLGGGGSDPGTCVIMLPGGLTPNQSSLILKFNSPDLNADLVVNLTDVSGFAQDFFSHTYAFRSDFHFDDVVNLSDLSVMADAVGNTCP